MTKIIYKKIGKFKEKEIYEKINHFPVEVKNYILNKKNLEDKIKRLEAYLIIINFLKDTNIYKEMPVYNLVNGKIYLKNYDVFISISHKLNFLVVAFSNNEIGVDVEDVCYIKDDLMKYVLNINEYEKVIKSDNKFLEFKKIWTKKESYLKMLSIGLVYNLKTILDDKNQCKFETFVFENHVITTCEKL